MSQELFPGAVLPQVLRVSVGSESLPELAAAEGDYLLQRVRRERAVAEWQLTFPPVAGCSVIRLLMTATAGGAEVSIEMLRVDGGAAARWSQPLMTDPRRPFRAERVPVAGSSGDPAAVTSTGAAEWAGIDVQPMLSAQPGSGSRHLQRFTESGSEQYPSLSVMGSSENACFAELGPCDWCDHCPDEVCHYWVPDQFQLDLGPVNNALCTVTPNCESQVRGIHTISRAMPCTWQKTPTMTCGHGELTVGFSLNADCELVLTVDLDIGCQIDPFVGDSVSWKKVIASGRCNDRELIAGGVVVGNQVLTSDGCCTNYPLTVPVTGIPPDPDWCLMQCIHTRAVIPALTPQTSSSPNGSGLDAHCTTCGSGASRGTFGIPGTWNETESCGGDCVTWDINLENGNVSLHLPMPSAGPGVPVETITLNSSSCVYSMASFFRQQITEIDDCSCDKRTCEGSKIRFANKNPSNGEYNPLDRTNSKLTRTGSGWLELDRGTGNQLSYDSGGRLVRVENAASQRWTVLYDMSGLRAVADPFSRRMTMTGSRIVDVYNRTTTILSTTGSFRQITPELCENRVNFDSSGRIRTWINPAGQATTFSYASDGMVTSVHRPDGQQYSFSYDDYENTTVSGPVTTTVRHDLMREVIEITNAVGGTQKFSYDNRDWLRGSVSAAGIRTTLIYAATNPNLRQAVVTAEGRTTSIYNAQNRLIAVVNPAGSRTTYVRDGSTGAVKATVNALNERTTSIYAVNGTQVATQNAAGARTTSVFDVLGQVIATINPLGARTTYAYANGQRTSTTLPSGAVSTTRFDLINRRRVTIDPLGARTSFVYDTCAAPIATINPLGARTTTVYSFGRVKATINPLGLRTSFAYGPAGQRART